MYVYETAKEFGFSKGLKAFSYRYKNCRSGFELFTNPIDGNMQMILPSKEVIKSDEIAEQLLNK